MKFFLLFLFILLGLAAYYEFAEVKKISANYQSVKLTNDSNGRINLTISLVLTNPSDIPITIGSLTGSVLIGTINAGLISLANPVLIAAGQSSAIPIVLVVPTNILSFQNLILILSTNPNITINTVVSATAFGITINSLEFPYVTNVNSVL